MFSALWRFLVYRVLGGRVLLAITVLAWFYRKLTGRRVVVTRTSDLPASGSTHPPGNEDRLVATRGGRQAAR